MHDPLAIPPYGKAGGSTRRSYTPNLYGPTMASSVSRNLEKYIVRYKALPVEEHVMKILWGIQLKLIMSFVHELGLSPDAALPVFAIDSLELFVHDIPGSDSYQV